MSSHVLSCSFPCQSSIRTLYGMSTPKLSFQNFNHVSIIICCCYAGLNSLVVVVFYYICCISVRTNARIDSRFSITNFRLSTASSVYDSSFSSVFRHLESAEPRPINFVTVQVDIQISVELKFLSLF